MVRPETGQISTADLPAAGVHRARVAATGSRSPPAAGPSPRRSTRHWEPRARWSCVARTRAPRGSTLPRITPSAGPAAGSPAPLGRRGKAGAEPGASRHALLQPGHDLLRQVLARDHRHRETEGFPGIGPDERLEFGPAFPRQLNAFRHERGALRRARRELPFRPVLELFRGCGPRGHRGRRADGHMAGGRHRPDCRGTRLRRDSVAGRRRRPRSIRQLCGGRTKPDQAEGKQDAGGGQGAKWGAHPARPGSLRRRQAGFRGCEVRRIAWP